MRRVLLALVLLVPVSASAKSLFWRALDVEARLGADARLNIVERQTYVFNGDWNGGERTFRLRAGQALDFESLTRVVDGVEKPLSRGDLKEVDHYDFTSPTVLRWRSRLPSDPEFENTEIVYVLRYSLGGVIRERGGTYVLDHDFAFPDREGVIQSFSLRLDLDPQWRGVSSPFTLTRRTLLPGESVVVRQELTWAGGIRPQTAVHEMAHGTTVGLFAVFMIALFLGALEFFWNENEKGRFDRLIAPQAIDAAWLEENLLGLKPEVAGAAWDEKVGAAEVAATLARMAQEGKISTRVEMKRNLFTERGVLHLRLDVDRNSLSGYESHLIRSFFFEGDDETDTDRIRTHYRNVGFAPAAIIESGLDGDLGRLPEWKKNPQATKWKKTLTYVAISAGLMFIAAFRGGNDTGVVVASVLSGFLFAGIAAGTAKAYSTAVTNLARRFAVPLLCISPFLWIVGAYTLSAGRLLLHTFTIVAMCAWAVALWKVMLDALRIRQTPAKIAFRKRLAAARNYFIAQLRSPSPDLRDAWYPYFLAFGLGKNVDRWFHAHGMSVATAGTTSGSSFGSSVSSASSSSTSSAAWSGGGGGFGGAGATFSWSVAAGALAAGVSAPSSGGSGGGSSSGGGGGGSSGGGGGGGW